MDSWTSNHFTEEKERKREKKRKREKRFIRYNNIWIRMLRQSIVNPIESLS